MVDDDDPINEQAPAGRPAEEKTKTPATEPPEGDKPEGEQPETAEPELDLGDEADDEQDDEEQDDDDEEEGDGEGDDKPKPKRRTGSERTKRQLARLKAENDALRARRESAVPSDATQLQRALEYAVWQEIGDPPNENDPAYKDNYVALERARQAWEFDRRQVTRQVRKDFGTAIAQEQQRVADLVAAHKEREAVFKKKVKDYDEVMARATLPVAPHVERLLIQSKKSERLGYVLGRNQAKLAQLNRMDPESAAREIGRIEGRLSLPTQPKTQTKARRPITPLKGGGSSPPTGLAAVNAYIKNLYGDRK